MVINELISVSIGILCYTGLKRTWRFNIMEQSYEMGVIKSLGAENGFVFRIFFYEALLLGVFATLISGVVLFVIDALEIIQMYQVPLMEFDFVHFLALLLSAVMIVVVSSLAEILKITRMPIVQAIGEKHI